MVCSYETTQGIIVQDGRDPRLDQVLLVLIRRSGAKERLVFFNWVSFVVINGTPGSDPSWVWGCVLENQFAGRIVEKLAVRATRRSKPRFGDDLSLKRPAESVGIEKLVLKLCLAR